MTEGIKMNPMPTGGVRSDNLASRVANTSVVVLPNLELNDPFMVASSHLTANENCFKQLAPYSPSALTLKTTSQRSGGGGDSTFGPRTKVNLQDSRGNSF